MNDRDTDETKENALDKENDYFIRDLTSRIRFFDRSFFSVDRLVQRHQLNTSRD